ncbi:hypothetical protein SAMN02745127_00885 [Oceanospirillum multiglobuliferum]|uniref:SH3b domain-containing protein n=1 Tax=Oceanospirillum multiglobuliferum TaxID=64969 RepID=A0A1T4MQQ1_9GAMM|nr:SH3 domain-containing protein [Oceanospirillum multiglobuliferum]OPX56924.1 hypothetical protein BTE48_00355 [Oceanospirillum multiglobuliferum]SJZ69293.1 hypothetical protein SAMN02745127_00885 [Oceanospirillum multiglobuliferum]
MTPSRLLVLLLILSSAWTNSLFAAETYYVQSQKADLLAKPKFSAEKLQKLVQGTAVQLLQINGNWMQVSVDQKVGWLSKLLLKKHPPLTRVSVLDRSDTELKDSVRRRSSSIVTAGAARGLTSEERSRIHQDNTANYFALKKLEQFTISQSELRQFALTLENAQ